MDRPDALIDASLRDLDRDLHALAKRLFEQTVQAQRAGTIDVTTGRLDPDHTFLTELGNTVLASWVAWVRAYWRKTPPVPDAADVEDVDVPF